MSDQPPKSWRCVSKPGDRYRSVAHKFGAAMLRHVGGGINKSEVRNKSDRVRAGERDKRDGPASLNVVAFISILTYIRSFCIVCEGPGTRS